MFTKKSSLILSAVITTFLISTSFPTMGVVQEAGLPEKSSSNAGSRWEQMIKKQQEEAAAEAAASKQAALDKEMKSMGKEIPEVKEPAKKPAVAAAQKEEVMKPNFKPGATWGERHLGKETPPAHKQLTYAQRLEKRNEELKKEKAEKEEFMARAKKAQEAGPSTPSKDAAQSPMIKKMMREQAKEEAASSTQMKKPQGKTLAERHLGQPNSPSQRAQEQVKEEPVKAPEPPRMDQKTQEATIRKGPPSQSPAMKRIMEKQAKEKESHVAPVQTPVASQMTKAEEAQEEATIKSAAKSPTMRRMMEEQGTIKAPVKAPAKPLEPAKELVMKPAEVTTLHSTTIHPPVDVKEVHPKLEMQVEEHETVTLPPLPSKVPPPPPLPPVASAPLKRAAPDSLEAPAPKKARVEAQQAGPPSADALQAQIAKMRKNSDAKPSVAPDVPSNVAPDAQPTADKVGGPPKAADLQAQIAKMRKTSDIKPTVAQEAQPKVEKAGGPPSAAALQAQIAKMRSRSEAPPPEE